VTGRLARIENYNKRKDVKMLISISKAIRAHNPGRDFPPVSFKLFEYAYKVLTGKLQPQYMHQVFEEFILVKKVSLAIWQRLLYFYKFPCALF